MIKVGDRVKVLDGSRASVADVMDRYGHVIEVADIFPNTTVPAKKVEPHLNIDFGEFCAWVPMNDVKLIESSK